MRILFELGEPDPNQKPTRPPRSTSKRVIPKSIASDPYKIWWAIATVILVIIQIYPPAWHLVESIPRWFYPTPQQIVSKGFHFPIQGQTLSSVIITDRPGSPRDGGRRVHAGIDLVLANGATEGAKIVSIMNGVVDESRPCLQINQTQWNYCLGIVSRRGESTYKHRYVHVNNVKVKPQQVVKAGQVIATIGPKDISSTGAHLHFELYREGQLDWHPDKMLQKANK